MQNLSQGGGGGSGSMPSHMVGFGSAQWWQEYPSGQTCPLSHFPISLLPYPPFKFRRDPSRP